jgi:hypothetical protein
MYNHVGQNISVSDHTEIAVGHSIWFQVKNNLNATMLMRSLIRLSISSYFLYSQSALDRFGQINMWAPEVGAD